MDDKDNAMAAATLGIITTKPRFPKYANHKERIKSFQNWPKIENIPVKSLVEAGFVYTGMGL